MELWKAAVLGIVQGLTEFLPVSSSGHLLLFERILGVDGGGLFLGVMLHAGTLLAVLGVYARRLWEMFRRARRQLLWLIGATLPAALVGVLLGDAIDRLFFGGEWLWAAFALTSLLLFLTDRKLRAGGASRPLTAGRAFAVGAAQRRHAGGGDVLRPLARGCRRFFLSFEYPRHRGRVRRPAAVRAVRGRLRRRRIVAVPRGRRPLRGRRRAGLGARDAAAYAPGRALAVRALSRAARPRPRRAALFLLIGA